MQMVRSFGVTHGNHKAGARDTFAGVVTIAQEYLDMAPESLLSIAANHSPDGEVIGLTSWPQPNVTALQVILPTTGAAVALYPVLNWT